MPVTAVIGCQWGDEGKGKVVDLLSREADIVARFQGGPNAGHTVVIDGEPTILHQIPSGILHENVTCCLGNGCVIDPVVLLEEVAALEESGVRVGGRLLISNKIHLIMPYHRAIDEASEKAAGKGKIGTTGRGIGPAYTDKYNRRGIRLLDLKEADLLTEKLRANVEDRNQLLTKYYGAQPLDVEKVIEEYLVLRGKMLPYAADVSLLLNEAIKENKTIVLEGAQGTLLDVDHGTYPYVTSSNPTAGAAASGSGIGPRKIDKVFGVLKAYTTRVGNGPFPTEFDEPIQSEFRAWGGEYGATTGRARRCGWLDLVIAKYSARINGLDGWVITKLDVLSRLEEIRVCTGYRYRGEKIVHFPPEPWILEDVEPFYEILPGWKSDISDIREYGRLPSACRDYLDFIQEFTGVPVHIVSVGAEREQTIRLR